MPTNPQSFAKETAASLSHQNRISDTAYNNAKQGVLSKN
jgi:hypothetical protein